MDPSALSPRQVVLDLVLAHSATMPKLGEAAVFNVSAGAAMACNLVIAAKNHCGQYVSLTVPVHFDGDPVSGAAPRFVLRRIGSTVWKLAPSVMHDLLHAYVTIVNVPEDVWGDANG